MNALLKLSPMLALTAFFGFGQAWAYAPGRLSPLSLALALALIPAMIILRRRGLASPIHWTMAAFIALGALAFALVPALAAGLGRGWPLVLYGLFALMASLPQLLGRAGFTTYFARRQTPEVMWQTDVFRDINRRMSWMWAGIFVMAGLAAGLPLWVPALSAPLPRALCQYILPAALMLGLGLPLNLRYPNYHLRRLGLPPLTAVPSGDPAPQPAAPEPAPQPALNTRKEDTVSTNPTVVAVNGSPHAGIGNSALMIEMLRPTLEAQGLKLEVIELAGQAITYCQGCGWCMEKGACWINDDHRAIVKRLLEADAVILASPVYFFHVTAQMKAFLDRCLAWGHKPRPSWKPGLAISVAAAVGEVETADYLGGVMKAFGAYSVGSLTALATGPGGFLGKELVEQRAADLASDLVRAVKEKRRAPATGRDLVFYLFMRDLVQASKDTVMKDDYKHWSECGLLESFEAYMQQERTSMPYDENMRKEWIKGMMAAQKSGQDPAAVRRAAHAEAPAAAGGPQAARTCRELLEMMPQGFKPQAAGDFKAIYQFEVRGSEEFSAHLVIADGACRFVEGVADHPDVTIKTPADVWLAISQGRLDGQGAFMSGKYQVEGNLMLLMRLKDIFGA